MTVSKKELYDRFTDAANQSINEGSVLEVIVADDAVPEDWEKLMNFLHQEEYEPALSVNGVVVTDLQDFDLSDNLDEDELVLLRIPLGNLFLDCVFYTIEEMSFNVALEEELPDEETTDEVLQFMQHLGDLLDKPVLLRAEDAKEVFFAYTGEEGFEIA